jgi:hypothetical protein
LPSLTLAAEAVFTLLALRLFQLFRPFEGVQAGFVNQLLANLLNFVLALLIQSLHYFSHFSSLVAYIKLLLIIY